MRIIETALLTGPYDWEPTVLPKVEYATRLERLRATLGTVTAGQRALLVHGHPGDHGALAYLTNFVPKFGSALALVLPEGGIRLLVPGSEFMLPSAKRLTWVENVEAAPNLARRVGEWLHEQAGAVGTWGFDSLPHGLHRAIAGAAAPWPLLPLDARLDAVRRRKSPLELHLMRGAAGMLAAASQAFTASAAQGTGARSAALAAERAAVSAGAQDARALVSVRPGGAPLPADSAADPVLDPVIAAIAVRNAGYWAAGYVTVARGANPALIRAKEGLAAALAATRRGATGASLLKAAAAALAPLSPHQATRDSIGHAIGLSLDEGAVGVIEAGATYLLAVGAAGPNDGAIASALVVARQDGVELIAP